VAEVATKTGSGHFDPWDDCLDLGHCLDKKDVEFLYQLEFLL
jgi:hypothetical protein